MKAGRVIALVVGCLLLVPGVGMLAGGGGLGLAYSLQRDDDGYFDVTLDRVASPAVAVTAEDLTYMAEPGSPDWLLDALDADVRIRATNADAQREIFIGIARETDVDDYLAGVARDEVTELDGLEPVYRSQTGDSSVAPPDSQQFWTASATGPGTQQLDWETTSGRWSVVLMNADGSAGVTADVNVGARAGFVLPLAFILLGLGLLTIVCAIVLIVTGAKGSRRADGAQPEDGTGAVLAPIPPAPAATPPVGAASEHEPHPVTLEARLDDVSRWKWLVKWILAIPHFVVLVFLWVAFAVLTLVAGVAILFTGRYPEGIFDFNVGVLRWSWRVNYYATNGGLGTDQYPPFSLHPEPGDPARLDIEYPRALVRWKVLVKWFLAIPHLVFVGLLTGGSLRWFSSDGDRFRLDPAAGGGLLGVLVIVAGVTLLFTGRYPRALFDLIVGLNRWMYRVTAYVALMTDEYPPFRLDQGGTEPRSAPPTPFPPAPLPPPSLDLQDSVAPDGELVAP